jgi:hypothetical protein
MEVESPGFLGGATVSSKHPQLTCQNCREPKGSKMQLLSKMLSEAGVSIQIFKPGILGIPANLRKLTPELPSTTVLNAI